MPFDPFSFVLSPFRFLPPSLNQAASYLFARRPAPHSRALMLALSAASPCCIVALLFHSPPTSLPPAIPLLALTCIRTRLTPVHATHPPAHAPNPSPLCCPIHPIHLHTCTGHARPPTHAQNLHRSPLHLSICFFPGLPISGPRVAAKRRRPSMCPPPCALLPTHLHSSLCHAMPYHTIPLHVVSTAKAQCRFPDSWLVEADSTLHGHVWRGRGTHARSVNR